MHWRTSPSTWDSPEVGARHLPEFGVGWNTDEKFARQNVCLKWDFVLMQDYAITRGSHCVTKNYGPSESTRYLGSCSDGYHFQHLFKLEFQPHWYAGSRVLYHVRVVSLPLMLDARHRACKLVNTTSVSKKRQHTAESPNMKFSKYCETVSIANSVYSLMVSAWWKPFLFGLKVHTTLDTIACPTAPMYDC